MDTREILERLSTEEKAGLLTGRASMETMEIERLGVGKKTMADGPHGVRFEEEEEKNSTCFPALCALSASWDKEAAYRMGRALGRECRHFGKDMLLGPGANIKRNILCGRNFEYLSEDPVLAGELAAGYIRGIQEEGVSACLKHFAVNNQEKDRLELNAEVDERTLREIYLKVFEIAVKKGKPDAVMCAYNKLNAIWCSENRFLLTEILRKEWGFEGLTVSDWGAVHHPLRALKAGMDLIMPQRRTLPEEIKAGLEENRISMEELDASAEHVLNWVTREKNEEMTSYSRSRQHEDAAELAAESMVLLKNDNGALPVTAQKYQKIAVVGEYAVSPLIGGQGSAEVYPALEYVDTPLECLREMMPETEIKYIELYQKRCMPAKMVWPETDKFRREIKDCDAVIFFAGEMESESTENFDRRSAEMNPNIEYFIKAACGWEQKVIVVLQSGSALLLGEWRNQADAVVQMWLGGEGAGKAVAQVLTGSKNPSGKLPETFPVCLRRDIDFGEHKRAAYREGLEVGYRYYDLHPEEIAYPFGHGLSYTEFRYTAAEAEIEEGMARIRVSVYNAGECAGEEVVQIYTGQENPVVSRPVKELKAFEKVGLEPLEEKTVEFKIPVREFGYYNVMLHDWTTEAGVYRIYIGASSRDIRFIKEVHLDGDGRYSVCATGDVTVG